MTLTSHSWFAHKCTVRNCISHSADHTIRHAEHGMMYAIPCGLKLCTQSTRCQLNCNSRSVSICDHGVSLQMDAALTLSHVLWSYIVSLGVLHHGSLATANFRCNMFRVMAQARGASLCHVAFTGPIKHSVLVQKCLPWTHTDKYHSISCAWVNVVVYEV